MDSKRKKPVARVERDIPDRAEAAAAILVARENLILAAFEWHDIGGHKQSSILHEAVELLRANMEAYRSVGPRRSR